MIESVLISRSSILALANIRWNLPASFERRLFILFFPSCFLFQKPAKPKKKIAFSDSEEESFQIEEDLEVAPRAERGRRARAAVKYNFGDSGAESQSD